MPSTIGIDVGGTKIAAGVVDEAGSIVARRRITTDASNPAALVAGIAKVAAELRAAAPAVSAIGVGAAGIVDVDRGVILSAPNISWSNVALRSLLEDRAGLPVIVDNDANVAALAEARFGAGVGVRDQIMVTIGTGIGGGFVFRGELYRGAHGYGAEVGHMILVPGGELCGCGNNGCWETVASGNAIGAAARARAGEPEAGPLVERAGGDPAAITGELVGLAAAEGDPFARGVVADAGRWLGLGLANLVNLLDPELVVAGGGVAAGSGELLLGPAREALASLVIGAGRVPPHVVAASLGNDAGIVGAGELARTLPPA